MHLDDCFADGKTQAKTFMSCTGLFEGVKDFFKKLWFDTNTIIADLDGKRVRVRVAGMDENSAVFRCEFVGIAKNIPKNLLQARRIDEQFVMRCFQSNGRCDMPILHFATYK